MSNVQLGYTQVIDPISFKSIPSGKIYIGEYGTLPNPANAGTWKQAYFVNSDGTRTAASQPIATNAAGYAVDGPGNIKTIQVDGPYSILVQDRFGATKFSNQKVSSVVDADDINIGNGRTQADKNAEELSAADFGVVGDGVVDDYAALSAFLSACRSQRKRGFVPTPAVKYKTTAPLDISGVDIYSPVIGYKNQNGTIIEGTGGFPIFSQLQTNLNNITYRLRGFRLKGGSVGLRMSYSAHCVIEDIHVTDSTDGFYCGVSGVLGPLWNNFLNCTADVTGVALSINGNSWANTNIFTACFFKGDTQAGYITATGGIGAVSNQFIDTEFAGGGTGITFGATKATLFDGCYFECDAPAIVITNFTLDLQLNGCTFGSLLNTNATGVNSFIWHVSGTCRISVNGGYIYLAGAAQNNLSFVRSDNTSLFALTMLDFPDQEISSSGWTIFYTGLPTANDKLMYVSDYTPVWSTTGTAPSLGNGTLKGRYVLSGNVCTAEIELIAGSTTTFGTGQFQITLPFTVKSTGLRASGCGRVSDTGTTFYIVSAEAITGSSLAVFYTNASANLVQSNSPMVWANGDTLRVTVVYEI